MKKWYILMVVCVILSIGAQMRAQEASYKILYEANSIGIGEISNNGEWIAYGNKGNAYYYNTVTEKSKIIVDAEHEGMNICGISNSGMLLGSYGINLLSPPACYKNNKWTILPVPEKRKKWDSMATCISDDETIIGGYIDGNVAGGESILPCIWKLKDGEYEYKILPQPEKDITGEICQGSCIRSMSADGSVLVGEFRIGDGFKMLPIIWKLGDNGEYSCKIWGEELAFNMEAENPGPFPRYEKYVTAPGGTPEYEEQYIAWDKLADEFQKKRTAFYKGKGKFELRNIAVSGNGRWMVIAYSENGSKKGLQACRLDLQNNIAVNYNGAYNTCPRAVLDDGTVFAFTPFNGYDLTGHIYKNENEAPKPLYEWIKETKGIDISEDFLFTIPIIDPETGEISEADSIITGCCTISKDGSTVLSYMADPDNSSRTINFYVRKEVPNNISSQTVRNISAYVNNNILYITGEIKDLMISDITGKCIYHSNSAEKTVSLNYFRKGIYLVQTLDISGETKINKIFVE